MTVCDRPSWRVAVAFASAQARWTTAAGGLLYGQETIYEGVRPPDALDR